MTRHKKAPVGAGALKRRRNVYNGMVSQKLARKKDGDQYKNSDWDRQLQVWKDAPIAEPISTATAPKQKNVSESNETK